LSKLLEINSGLRKKIHWHCYPQHTTETEYRTILSMDNKTHLIRIILIWY